MIQIFWKDGLISLKAPLERTLSTVQNTGLGRATGRRRLGTNIKFQQNSTVV